MQTSLIRAPSYSFTESLDILKYAGVQKNPIRQYGLACWSGSFQPIIAEWTLLPLLFGQVHFYFLYKGCLIGLLLTCFVQISELEANSVDLDQTPRSAASDQGLHCLQMSLFMGR